MTVVNDCHAQFLSKSDKNAYTKYILNENVVIPLKMKGVLSHLLVCMQTKYLQIEMTSILAWDPYDQRYEKDELNLRQLGQKVNYQQ